MINFNSARLVAHKRHPHPYTSFQIVARIKDQRAALLSCNFSNAPAGFTMLELLVCLLLIGVLGAVSLPNLQALTEQQRGASLMSSLASAIALGRSTAITTGEVVTLCRSKDGIQCGGQWQDGVLLFTDSNADRNVNQGDRVMRYFTFPEAAGSLNWKAFQNRQYLQFTSVGHTRNQNGSFTYCPASKKSDLARQLIVSRTARARFAVDSDGDGIREDSEGKPLVCE